MADELTLNASISHNELGTDRTITNLLITVAGVDYWTFIESVTTSDTAFTAFATVTTKGWCLLRSLSDDAIIQWGPDVGGALELFGELWPGEIALFRMDNAVSYRMQTVAGEAFMEVIVIED